MNTENQVYLQRTHWSYTGVSLVRIKKEGKQLFSLPGKEMSEMDGGSTECCWIWGWQLWPAGTIWPFNWCLLACETGMLAAILWQGLSTAIRQWGKWLLGLEGGAAKGEWWLIFRAIGARLACCLYEVANPRVKHVSPVFKISYLSSLGHWIDIKINATV